jgi:hypothetical protein
MANNSRLEESQRRALARLKPVAALKPFYLAGGSAVAFHLGHRVSRDLDLFSATGEVDLQALQGAVTRDVPEAEVLAITDATLQIRLEGLPVDLVRYAHPLLQPAEPGPEGFNVASRIDLAAMKLAAIAHRGLRRDFWDLHALLTTGAIALNDALDAYVKRFRKSEPDLYHVLRSLTFFDDAEHEPLMPAGLTREHWQDIRRYFATCAPHALKQRAGDS